MFQQGRLRREVRAHQLGVHVRNQALRQHVRGFGQQLHRKLGTVGLVASGFGAGLLFGRLRARQWRGIYAVGGLAMSLLRLGPMAAMASRMVTEKLHRGS